MKNFLCLVIIMQDEYVPKLSIFVHSQVPENGSLPVICHHELLMYSGL